MKFFLFSLCMAFFGHLHAQTVTHGPITGGVTHESARFMIRTDVPATVTLELSVSPTFMTTFASFDVTTLASNDQMALASYQGLNPNTQYYVRATINGSPSGQAGSFKSFPTPGTPGNYKILGGSCMRPLDDNDSAMFVNMRNQNANIFIQYGDWGYPDNTGTTDVYFTNPRTSWAADSLRVLQHYKNVFNSTNSGPLIRNIVLNHVFDDHDYNNDNGGGDFASAYCVPLVNCNPSEPLARPITVPMPPQTRTNLIRGYEKYFPTYPLNDPINNGIYHKITLGNADIFVLDLRSMRTSQHEAIKRVSGTWVYDPPANHTLLGQQQLNWLLNGLQTSTATWKIIISSMTFNLGNKRGLDTCIAAGANTVPLFSQQIQSVAPFPGLSIVPGYLGAARFADKWVGFPAEHQQVLDLVRQNNIQNVFIMSGDTHNAGIDDGTHSGIPELMSGNLKVSNRGEAKESMEFLGFNIWNMGGSGLCAEDNFDRTYGMIEIFGEDSIVLSAVNPQGQKVASGKFLKNQPYRYDPNFQPNRIPMPQNDDFLVVQDSLLVMNVLANDSDPDNDSMYVVVVAEDLPTKGTIQINPDNTVTYTPEPGYIGPDAFTYKACDVNGFQCECCIRATVFIDVQKSTGIYTPNPEMPKVTVYPNPSDQMVHFRIDQHRGLDYVISILNALGEPVHALTATDRAWMDVSHWPSGSYQYVVYRKRDRQKVATGQFIKTGR